MTETGGNHSRKFHEKLVCSNHVKPKKRPERKTSYLITLGFPGRGLGFVQGAIDFVCVRERERERVVPGPTSGILEGSFSWLQEAGPWPP